MKIIDRVVFYGTPSFCVGMLIAIFFFLQVHLDKEYSLLVGLIGILMTFSSLIAIEKIIETVVSQAIDRMMRLNSWMKK